MEKTRIRNLLLLTGLLATASLVPLTSQGIIPEEAVIDLEDTHQTLVGFGASLAYYENWLTAHPKKAEIYDAIFGELSLDILRVRNAFGYDPGMVGRVEEFVNAARNSLGKPIALLSTSWGPPGYLKSNQDRSNGGTLRFTTGEGGITFDYPGFAQWWDSTLSDYNSHGIYPAYISIQNEPDWSASYESCRFDPTEKVTVTDTIAGYNKALQAVHDTLALRDEVPRLLGPETIGIGYNAVENYTNALDISLLDGIAHHLYHGVDENDPYATTNLTKVGDFQPGVPHFQTEYNRGDWFSLAGLMYKSLHDEEVVAYLYWDLIWDGGGLVSLDFPWDVNRWQDPGKGYTKTRNFYTFKQYSAFILPGYTRLGTEVTGSDAVTVTFTSEQRDTLVSVAVNRSETDTVVLHVTIPGYAVDTSEVYITSDSLACEYSGELVDSTLVLPPHAVGTVRMRISEYVVDRIESRYSMDPEPLVLNGIYPNPFTEESLLQFSLARETAITLTVFDIRGRMVRQQMMGCRNAGEHRMMIRRGELAAGIYFFRLEDQRGNSIHNRFVIK